MVGFYKTACVNIQIIRNGLKVRSVYFLKGDKRKMRLNLDLGAPSNSLLMVCSMILFAHIALIVECETKLW